jgi:hypothetical protein
MTELRKKSIKVLDNLEKCFENAIQYINEIKTLHYSTITFPKSYITSGIDREQTIENLEYLIHDWCQDPTLSKLGHNDELLNWFKILNDELIILKGVKK